MSSILKKCGVIAGLVVLLTSVVYTASDPSYPRNASSDEINPFIDNALIDSSRFTQPEDMRPVDPDDYIDIVRADTFMLENDHYELYMNQTTLAFKVLDKASGYVWSTSIHRPEADTESFTKLLQSGIGFEYIEVDRNMNLRRNIGITDTVFTYDMTIQDNDIILDIYVGGFCARAVCRLNFPRYLEGEIDLDRMIEHGYTELSFEFQLIVSLTDEGIRAHIPFNGISENRDEFRLSSFIVFPAMGATRMDDIPGYMFIPDGVGALIRYTDNQGRYSNFYDERFYGPNAGVSTIRQSVTNYPLSMPVFGAVHGVHQHAFLGIIESGAPSSRLIAFPNGVGNQNHNLIFTKYDIMSVYTQSFQSDGSGGAQRTYQLSDDDFTIRFDFLRDDAADYVGMANHYQAYLRDQGDITRQLAEVDDIPIHLQYLMADSKSQFIGKSLVEMTSVDDVMAMYDHFMIAGLINQRVSLLGWNRGGYSGNLPSALTVERRLRGEANFDDLIAHINEANSVMLVNNYVRAGADARRISVRSDVAQGVNRFRLEHLCIDCVHTRSYLLYPEHSMNLALDDYDRYHSRGVDVLFEMLGSTLFSYYDRQAYPRSAALPFYESIMARYEGRGHYRYPNAYAYPYTTEFFDAPLYNSQLNYFDDLVPFLPIVLRGHMNLYSQFLNFNSLGTMQLLMLVDFGIYPSYVLTKARSSNLAGTDIERYYATQFDAWSETIIEQYRFINEALRFTHGETIVAREVINPGVVKVTYTNNVEIIINYTHQETTVNGDVVSALSYRVKGGQP